MYENFEDLDDFFQIDFELSPVKKEQLLRDRKYRIRKKLRADLPVLTAKDIRRHRLPHYKSLLLDLQDDGYVNTAEFIQQLLAFQERIRKKFGPGSAIYLRPQLLHSKQDLDLLAQRLTNAETAHNEHNFINEWEEIMLLATHYAFGPDDWWWLGEQLLYQVHQMKYTPRYEKQETTTHYVIGKYLSANGTKVESGKHFLETVREKSMGKSWNCKKFLKEDTDTIFTESCRVLSRILMDEAKTLIETDPDKSLEICAVARKRANESCEHKTEFEALMLKAKCELKLQRSGDAIATVTKALNRCVKRQYTQGICESKITLALAYLQRGKFKESLSCLQDLKKIGQESDMAYYIGQSYRFMGEYYLSQKQPKEATPLLMFAFYIFNQINNREKREKVRNWAAISAGEELFPAYIQLIKKCEGCETHEGYENMMTLIAWIDERTFFWTQESKFSFSYSTLKKSVNM